MYSFNPVWKSCLLFYFHRQSPINDGLIYRWNCVSFAQWALIWLSWCINSAFLELGLVLISWTSYITHILFVKYFGEYLSPSGKEEPNLSGPLQVLSVTGLLKMMGKVQDVKTILHLQKHTEMNYNFKVLKICIWHLTVSTTDVWIEFLWMCFLFVPSKQPCIHMNFCKLLVFSAPRFSLTPQNLLYGGGWILCQCDLTCFVWLEK
jgi:hypothetical protein